MSVQDTFHFHACYVGSRIDTRELEKSSAVLLAPLMLRAGNRGHAVIFRFGVIVFINMNESERHELLQQLQAKIQVPTIMPACEELDAHLGDGDTLEKDGRLELRDGSPERLQVVAAVLAKSAVLAHYELALSTVFDRIEILADSLRRGVKRVQDPELLREIGDVLLIQSRMVGRVEVAEKPENTWDSPELDRLYEKLAVEYELRERDRAVTRKLEVVSDTARTHLELLHNRRSIRVEWYIVLLIVFEILWSFYLQFSG